jgi:stage IV sporulation protein FB
MRDPLTWSLPLGRLFGITIRVHILFPLIAVGLILRAAFKEHAQPDDWIIAAGMMLILFLSVLLHEFGHCFAARWMDGDAQEILMWPLGGLAFVDVPQTWRANLVTVVGGPMVNVLLCMASGAILMGFTPMKPPFDPRFNPYWFNSETAYAGLGLLPWQIWVVRVFYLNYILFLFNLIPGFPLDGGRIFQCLLWPRLGFRQATLAAVFAGFVSALCIGVYAIVLYDPLFLFLTLFVYLMCRQQWFILEHGGEESLFGYDFSQGYTSLEREQPTRRKRPNAWQRWWQRRKQRQLQREMEQREAEERRMDELLEKVQREGLQALSDEERRFLTRVSHKYRNRQ